MLPVFSVCGSSGRQYFRLGLNILGSILDQVSYFESINSGQIWTGFPWVCFSFGPKFWTCNSGMTGNLFVNQGRAECQNRVERMNPTLICQENMQSLCNQEVSLLMKSSGHYNMKRAHLLLFFSGKPLVRTDFPSVSPEGWIGGRGTELRKW